MKYIKLLYLANRKALIERGRPISTDRYVSMDNGPVLSKTFNLIQGNDRDSDLTWASLIEEATDHDVTLKDTTSDLVLDELSKAEINDLTSIFNAYGNWNRIEPGNRTSHLWIVITDPEENGGDCVIVNVHNDATPFRQDNYSEAWRSRFY